jgi:hypothetical protein
VFGFFLAVQAIAHREGIEPGVRYAIVSLRCKLHGNSTDGRNAAELAHWLDLDMLEG